MDQFHFYKYFLGMEEKASSLIDRFHDDQMNLWPLIRVGFRDTFYLGHLNRYKERCLAPRDGIHLWHREIPPHVLRAKNLCKDGCLVVGIPELYTQQYDGKRYDHYLDGVVQQARQMGMKSLKIVLGELSGNQETFVPALQLPAKTISQNFVEAKHIGEHPAYDEYVELSLESQCPPLSYLYILQMQANILAMANYFQRLLEAMQPRMVVLRCYYDSEHMGVALACSRLGIPCVEYQHGVQEWPHMHYNFPHIPENGFNLIPEYFWLWGEPTQRNLQKSFAGQSYHKAVLAGQPSYIARSREWVPTSESGDALKSVINGRTAICVLLPLLISEQAIAEFEAAIEQSPDNWIWLIREHPLHKNVELQNILKKCPGKVETALSCKLRLDTVLSLSDHVVADSSTTVHEAICFFNLKATLLSSKGLSFFANYEEGWVTYAQTSGDILGNIERSLNNKERIKEECAYVTPDTAAMEKAFQKTLT